uniref:Uncharacterized protein n=1 Tax=Romanomermis culicivorax TaxID=13658 RepID=A0A915K5N6_ROMCU
MPLSDANLPSISAYSIHILQVESPIGTKDTNEVNVFENNLYLEYQHWRISDHRLKAAKAKRIRRYSQFVALKYVTKEFKVDST